MVTQYGMSELGFISLEAVPHPSLISEKRKAEIEAAVHKLISEAQERALEIIRRRIDDLRKMVVEVKARETLLAGDFEELFMRGSQSEESASSS
jgi:ATP-dependent Zn protease